MADLVCAIDLKLPEFLVLKEAVKTLHAHGAALCGVFAANLMLNKADNVDQAILEIIAAANSIALGCLQLASLKRLDSWVVVHCRCIHLTCVLNRARQQRCY
jgi:hypothetical protein